MSCFGCIKFVLMEATEEKDNNNGVHNAEAPEKSTENTKTSQNRPEGGSPGEPHLDPREHTKQSNSVGHGAKVSADNADEDHASLDTLLKEAESIEESSEIFSKENSPDLQDEATSATKDGQDGVPSVSLGREAFLRDLYKFMEEKGTPITKAPSLGFQELDLHKLYLAVISRGGMDKVTQLQAWKAVYLDLNLPTISTSASYNTRTNYKKYLYLYELEHFEGEDDGSHDGHNHEISGNTSEDHSVNEYIKIESTVHDGQIYYAKILKRRSKRGVHSYYVQYNGWSISHNEWMPKHALQKLSPEEEILPERLPNPPSTRSSKSNYLIEDHVSGGRRRPRRPSSSDSTVNLSSFSSTDDHSGSELSSQNPSKRPRKKRPETRVHQAGYDDAKFLGWVTEEELPIARALASLSHSSSDCEDDPSGNSTSSDDEDNPKNYIKRPIIRMSSASLDRYYPNESDEDSNQEAKQRSKWRPAPRSLHKSDSRPVTLVQGPSETHFYNKNKDSSVFSRQSLLLSKDKSYTRVVQEPHATSSPTQSRRGRPPSAPPSPISSSFAPNSDNISMSDIYASIHHMRHSVLTPADLERERTEREKLHQLESSTLYNDPPPITSLNAVTAALNIGWPDSHDSVGLALKPAPSKILSLESHSDIDEDQGGDDCEKKTAINTRPISTHICNVIKNMGGEVFGMQVELPASESSLNGEGKERSISEAASMLKLMRESILTIEGRLKNARKLHSEHVKVLQELEKKKKDRPEDGPAIASSSRDESDEQTIQDENTAAAKKSPPLAALASLKRSRSAMSSPIIVLNGEAKDDATRAPESSFKRQNYMVAGHAGRESGRRR